MSVRCLVDTNILVYAVDARGGRKSITANAILGGLASQHEAVTTAQAVSEFYRAVTRPRGRAPLLRPPEAVAWLGGWLGVAVFVDLTADVAREALRAALRYQMNIFDAQMWATARVYTIPVLLTEDAQFQPEIEGVRYVNPFAPSFEPADFGL